jgi:CRP-like cAMP-binding protein
MRKVLLIFGVLSDQDVDWLTAHGRRQSLAAGDVLVREGRTLESLYIVLQGAFAVRLATRRGEAVARLYAGEVVGEVSFVDSRTPIGTVVALTAATVWTLPQSLVADQLVRDPAFAARFYRAIALTLAYRLRKMMLSAANPASPEGEGADELDDNVLDNVHLAGARFERMLKRVMVG